jgi:hypothetical protein
MAHDDRIHEGQDDEGADDALCYSDPAAAQAPALPAPEPLTERRQTPRMTFKAAGTIEPVATGAAGDVHVVTRDADPRGTGFVAAGPLPEGTRAVLHLPAPTEDGTASTGRTQRIECRVRRSRELGNGLFEGSVEFVGEQPQFSDTRISVAPMRRR